MPKVIPIQKELVPYEFDIRLENKIYTMFIDYNSIGDFFTVSLSLGDTKLVEGQKLVLNREVFKDLAEDNEGNYDENYPYNIIIPIDISGKEQTVNYENFGVKTFVYMATREELGIT